MVTIGIDPGTTGALAFLDDEGKLLAVHDMPTLTYTVGKSNRTRISPGLLASLLYSQLMFTDCTACIEQVAAMPKQGVSSVFTFGQAYGVALGVLAGCQIPILSMQPRKWRALAGLKAGNSKDDARQRVIEMFPDWSDTFKRKKDHNRADAVLIAIAGYKSGEVAYT